MASTPPLLQPLGADGPTRPNQTDRIPTSSDTFREEEKRTFGSSRKVEPSEQNLSLEPTVSLEARSEAGLEDTTGGLQVDGNPVTRLLKAALGRQATVTESGLVMTSQVEGQDRGGGSEETGALAGVTSQQLTQSPQTVVGEAKVTTPTTGGSLSKTPTIGGSSSKTPTTWESSSITPTTGGSSSKTPTTEGSSSITTPTIGESSSITPMAGRSSSITPTTGKNSSITTSTTRGSSSITPTTGGSSSITPTTGGSSSITPTAGGSSSITPTTGKNSSITTPTNRVSSKSPAVVIVNTPAITKGSITTTVNPGRSSIDTSSTRTATSRGSSTSRPVTTAGPSLGAATSTTTFGTPLAAGLGLEITKIPEEEMEEQEEELEKELEEGAVIKTSNDELDSETESSLGAKVIEKEGKEEKENGRISALLAPSDSILVRSLSKDIALAEHVLGLDHVGEQEELQKEEELGERGEFLEGHLSEEQKSVSAAPAVSVNLAAHSRDSGNSLDSGDSGDSLDSLDSGDSLDSLDSGNSLDSGDYGDSGDLGDYLDYNLDYGTEVEPESQAAPVTAELGGGQYRDYYLPQGVIRLPYNFSGLQFQELTEPPRVWNAREAFMEQVGYKLYMFVPAAAAGVLLGILIWVVALLCLRAYGCLRRTIFGEQQKCQELELRQEKAVWQVEPLGPPEPSIYFDSRKVEDFNQRVEKLVRGGFLGAEEEERGRKASLPTSSRGREASLPSSSRESRKDSLPSSSRSSPKSISSGIGVSEKETSDKEDEERVCHPPSLHKEERGR